MPFAPRFIRVYEGQFQKLISRFAKSAYPTTRLLPPIRADRGIALVGFGIRHKPIRTRGLGADIRRIRHLVVRHAAVLTFRSCRALRIREAGATRLSVPLHRPAEFAFGRAVRFFITRTPLSPVRIRLAAIRANRCGIAVGRIPARARLGSVPHRRTAEFADGRAVRGIPTSAVLSSVRRRLPAELANGVDNEHPALVAFMKYQNIEALNREILVELVDYIKVYENGNISVKFKFADELRKIAEYIEINTTEDTAVAG